MTNDWQLYIFCKTQHKNERIWTVSTIFKIGEEFCVKSSDRDETCCHLILIKELIDL